KAESPNIIVSIEDSKRINVLLEVCEVNPQNTALIVGTLNYLAEKNCSLEILNPYIERLTKILGRLQQSEMNIVMPLGTMEYLSILQKKIKDDLIKKNNALAAVESVLRIGSATPQLTINIPSSSDDIQLIDNFSMIDSIDSTICYTVPIDINSNDNESSPI